MEKLESGQSSEKIPKFVVVVKVEKFSAVHQKCQGNRVQGVI